MLGSARKHRIHLLEHSFDCHIIRMSQQNAIVFINMQESFPYIMVSSRYSRPLPAAVCPGVPFICGCFLVARELPLCCPFHGFAVGMFRLGEGQLGAVTTMSQSPATPRGWRPPPPSDLSQCCSVPEALNLPTPKS